MINSEPKQIQLMSLEKKIRLDLTQGALLETQEMFAKK